MIGLMTIISVLMGQLSIIFFLPLLFYTILAKKDFFFADDFKIKYLFTYNIINMLQILLLQIFIYVSILDDLILDNILSRDTKIIIALISGAVWIYYRDQLCYKIIPRKNIPVVIAVVIWIYLNYHEPLFLPIGLLILYAFSFVYRK